MEPESLLSCSQETTTGSCPEPDTFNSDALCLVFGKKLFFFFYCDDLLAPRQTTKLEDYPLLVVLDCPATHN